jgi:2-pyrone-4,6-dicarboxylate lactonase
MPKSMSPPVLTFNPNPSQPRLALPAGACDTHVHIFGPHAQFPFADARNFTPADAGKETLFALHRQLGIARCVIVQSMIHGFDNSAVEDAIAASGGRYLGVALVAHDVPYAELRRLKDAGFRGVRFHFGIYQGQGASVQQVIALTQRLAPLGLHLQIHFDGPAIHELAPLLKASAVQVVIDHMGRVDASLGERHADFRALRLLMEDPRFYVKVSGIDRVSKAPPYTEGMALARRLVNDFPDRCFWGTDWPHPNHHHVPDDGVLVDALAQIAPTPAALEALLVSNPQRFYRFDA